jgi:phosphatidylglycerol:prolipoprotein diacylglycerol transferase
VTPWPDEYRRAAYAGFMLLAVAVFLLARRLAPRPPGALPLPWWKRLGLGLAAFIGGSLGGKLPFVLGRLKAWLDGSAPVPEGNAFWPQLLGAWLGDGKTITAALIGAYLAVELAKRLLDVRAKTGDSFAVPLALAMAVGRWGCFFNGCCYGTPTDLPWGVPFAVPDGDGVRWVKCHPTQIYESLFHFTAALALLWLARRDLFPRQRLKLYLIAYGVYRFLTEFIRPEPRDYAGLTFYQWAALLLAAGLAVQWWADRRAPALRAAV